MHERRKALLKKGTTKYDSNQESKLVIEKKIKQLLSSPPQSISSDTEHELEKLASKITALIYDTYLTNGSTAQEFTELWDSFLEHAKCCDWYIDKNEECIIELKSKLERMIFDQKAEIIGEYKEFKERIEALEKAVEPLARAKAWYADTKTITAFIGSIIALVAAWQGYLAYLKKIGGDT